jgi:hypothetical protein
MIPGNQISDLGGEANGRRHPDVAPAAAEFRHMLTIARGEAHRVLYEVNLKRDPASLGEPVVAAPQDTVVAQPQAEAVDTAAPQGDSPMHQRIAEIRALVAELTAGEIYQPPTLEM